MAGLLFIETAVAVLILVARLLMSSSPVARKIRYDFDCSRSCYAMLCYVVVLKELLRLLALLRYIAL